MNYRVGMKFHIEYQNDDGSKNDIIYMLVSIGKPNMISLMNTFKKDRVWLNPIPVEDRQNITQEEFNQISGNYKFNLVH